MKKFIIKSAIFIIICIALALAVEYVYYRYGDWRQTIDGWEVYTAIRNSKTKQGKRKLLIGDSVGMQLFPCNENNDSVALCTCNQAVTMAGFYMLMKNYLQANEECLPEEVILLITPLSLHNNVDEYTYHYFLKPFKFREYYSDYSPLLRTRIRNIPFWWTATLPFIRTSMYMQKYHPDMNEYSFSPLAKEYLHKMDSLAKEYNVDFVMRSAPVKQCHKDSIESRLKYEEGNMNYLHQYLNNLQYMNDSCYVDKVHFTDEVLQTIEKSYLLR